MYVLDTLVLEALKGGVLEGRRTSSSSRITRAREIDRAGLTSGTYTVNYINSVLKGALIKFPVFTDRISELEEVIQFFKHPNRSETDFIEAYYETYPPRVHTDGQSDV